MITFPTTPERFLAEQEKIAGHTFDARMRELIGEYVELFNLDFDAGVNGGEPTNIIQDTAEFYARRGKLERLEDPRLQHFYACVQYWCNEAYRQGKEAAQHE